MNQSMFSANKFKDPANNDSSNNQGGYKSQQNSATKDRGESELIKKMRLEGILKSIVKNKPNGSVIGGGTKY